MIKISVIVPVYKVPLEYLQDCFHSLTVQTMQDCEFIVVSDGAPKAECSICEEYVSKDARFKFFKRKHVGVSATRNYGINLAQGEYITFVDSDDFLQNNALEICYKWAKKWNSDILATNYIEETIKKKVSLPRVWHSKPIPEINKTERESILREFIHLKPNSISRGPWGKLYRRQLLLENNLSFATHLTIGEDLVFNFFCFCKAPTLSFLSKSFYFYRSNTRSVTKSFNRNFFYERIKPILEIQKQLGTKFEDLLGREALNIFFQSWPHCYMNPQNTDSLYCRMKQIRQIINNSHFQDLLSKANTDNMNFFVKLEILFFKRKIIIPIWLHAIKAILLKAFLLNRQKYD